jgi:hypothetical protein
MHLLQNLIRKKQNYSTVMSFFLQEFLSSYLSHLFHFFLSFSFLSTCEFISRTFFLILFFTFSVIQISFEAFYNFFKSKMWSCDSIKRRVRIFDISFNRLTRSLSTFRAAIFLTWILSFFIFHIFIKLLFSRFFIYFLFLLQLHV